MSEDQAKRVYEIKNIYLKDASFESPIVPQYFSEPTSSSAIDIDVNVQSIVLNEEGNLFESVLMLRITARTEDKTLFLIELSQAGIIELSGFSDSDIEKLLNIAVPNALLPFARETIASLATKGGFPQLLIRPLNFDRIYNEKLKAQQEKAQDQQTEH